MNKNVFRKISWESRGKDSVYLVDGCLSFLLFAIMDVGGELPFLSTSCQFGDIGLYGTVDEAKDSCQQRIERELRALIVS